MSVPADDHPPHWADAELADRLRDGSSLDARAAFAELDRRFSPILYRAATLRLNNNYAAVCDSVQNTLLDVWEKRSRIPRVETCTLRQHLYGVVRHKCADQMRTSIWTRVVRLSDNLRAAHAEDPADRAAMTEVQTALFAAVERLPPDERDAFIGAETFGLTYAEMSEKEDVSVFVINMRLRRARLKIKQALTRRFAKDYPDLLNAITTSHTRG